MTTNEPRPRTPALSPTDRAAGENYRRALVVFAIVVAVVAGTLRFPIDDALRHVGLAFAEKRGWGDVYPHSIFAQNPGYDPWWGFDQALRAVAAAVRPLGMPRLVAQTIVVKALSSALLAAFLLLALRAAGMASVVKSRASLAAAAALVVLFLGLPANRMLAARPFVLASLFLLFALPGGGALRGLLASGALAVCYPYLFWIYTIPAAAAHLARGDRRFGAAALAVTAAGVAVQPQGFRGLLDGLARSDRIRSVLTLKIGELRPVTDEALLAYAVLAATLCLLPLLPAASRRLGVPHVLMLFFLPPSVKYLRYLIDVEMVLLFVVCAGPLVEPLAGLLGRVGSFWAEWLRTLAARVRIRPRAAASGQSAGDVNLRPAIFATSAVLLAALAWGSSQRVRADEDLARMLEPVPRGALVLAEFDLQYRLLFVRPDLRLVPSSEIGFPTEAILPAYLRFMNDGAPCELAHAIAAEWFAAPALMPLDPEQTGCLAAKVGQSGGAPRQAAALWRLGPAR